MEETLQEVVSNMKLERDKLNSHIIMVSELKMEAVDEEKWHELCKAPIRHKKDVICEIARKTFPNGTNFTAHPNHVDFNLNGFNVSIPTTACKGVKIDMKWYREADNNLCLKNTYKSMRKYFKLLDNGNCNWYDLAKCRNNASDRFSKFRLFIWWFGKAKWYKVDRAKWDKMFKMEDEYNDRKKQEREDLVKRVESTKPLFVKTVDELKKFSEVKGYMRNPENGIYQTVNVEKLFRGE